MYPSDALSVRSIAQQAAAADIVARWFVELILDMPISSGKALPCIAISAPSLAGSVFRVDAHHQQLAGFQRHGRSRGSIVARIDLVAILLDGALGPSIMSITFNGYGMEFDDGTFVQHEVRDSAEYDAIRLSATYRILDAVQKQFVSDDDPRTGSPV